MRSPSQLAESVQRFQDSFWNKRLGNRPPVAVVHEGILLPIQYLRRPLVKTHLEPEDIGPALTVTDYQFDLRTRQVFCDDWVPFNAAWRGVPWLEAWCGCLVRTSSGSLAPGHWVQCAEQLADLVLPVRPDWLDCLRRETQALADQSPADCLVSPTILRGASDVLGALRGLPGFFTDLYDAPETIRRLAHRINQLLLDSLEMHFSIVSPKHGGYGHVFGYWAPEKTICLQEDALGMCRSEVYRDLFMEGTAEIVRRLGPCVLFHLHTTGFRHYRDVLRVPGIAGLQFTIEANGPTLLDMVPIFREVLEASRLILFVDHGFGDLPEALRRLPHEGLYLLINDRHLPSEDAYRQFISRHWGRAD
jgi:hypothetical protein